MKVSMRLIGLVIVLAVSLVRAPLAVEAQEHRIGFLGPRTPSETERFLQAFRQGLSKLGWVEGKNITIEYRFAEGKRERLPDLAAELLRHNVEIVVVEGGEAASVVQQMSKTIPIVMAEATAPVERGLVQSLARSGGNITGLSISPLELIGKRLELLKEVVPKLSRLGVLWNPRSPASALAWKEIEAHAVLASTVFPRGDEELCIEDDVVVVHPKRAVHIAHVLRANMIALHRQGLTLQERGTKMVALYRYMSSGDFRQHLREASELIDKLRQLDAQERDEHEKRWKMRERLHTRLKASTDDIDTQVTAITEQGGEAQPSAA